MELEYENLMAALMLALAAMVAIYNLYFALSRYLNSIQDQSHGLQLGQTVLSSLETYPVNEIEGRLGFESANVIGDVANWQFIHKRYTNAEAAYQKVLKLVSQLNHIDNKKYGRIEAGTYHQLGLVAEKQRHFAQAE